MPIRGFLDVLDRGRCGVIVLSECGDVLELNGTARRLLHARTGNSDNDPRSAIKKLLGQAHSRFSLDCEQWAVVAGEGERHLIMHAVPVASGSGVSHTILLLIDLGDSPTPGKDALVKMFELTPAECKVAIGLAAGKSLREIANEMQVALTTSRSQLSSVFAKTRTTRQSELVALLSRVALIP